MPKDMLPKECKYVRELNQVVCKSTCDEKEDERIKEQVARWAYAHRKDIVRTRHIRRGKEVSREEHIVEYEE